MSMPPALKKATVVISSMPTEESDIASLKARLRDEAFIYVENGVQFDDKVFWMLYYNAKDGEFAPMQRFTSGGASNGIGGTLIGQSVFFSGKNPSPDLVLADGSILSGVEYPDAMLQFGDVYGGDGITTFGIPDLRSSPPTSGGKWMVNVGIGTSATVYCGMGYFCGADNLYCGSLISSMNK